MLKTSSVLVVTKKVVTETGETTTIKKGDKRFRRYSWQLKSDLLTVLIQYVGDETIETVNYHGNCKSEKPHLMNPLLPSTREIILNSPKTPARIYEHMRLNAGTTAYEQAKFVPHNKNQKKNLAPCTLHPRETSTRASCA